MRKLDPNTTHRKCVKCNEVKPLEEFAKRKSNPLGRGHTCKKCKNAYDKARWHAAWRRNRLGEKLRMKEKKAGCKRPLFCKVCGSNKTICFDHDHTTDQFRGWICNGCNRALGLIKDNPVTLRRLASYLEGEL